MAARPLTSSLPGVNAEHDDTGDTRLRAQSPQARLLVDFTGLDDDSAVRARAASPAQDGCRPDDTPAALTAAGLDRGATQRWTIALAHAAGLGVVAENPGPPDLPNTGGTAQSDSEAEQMVQAGSYARGCYVEAWYLAFEDQLFEPGSGIDVASYGRVVAGGNRVGGRGRRGSPSAPTGGQRQIERVIPRSPR